jgi:hypothetical protein
MLLAFAMAALFGGSTIAPDRVVNGFALRRCQRIQSDTAPKTKTTDQAAEIAIDIPKLVAETLAGSDHDARRS